MFVQSSCRKQNSMKRGGGGGGGERERERERERENTDTKWRGLNNEDTRIGL